MGTKLKKVFHEIKSLKIQGATMVASKIAVTLKDYGERIKTNNLRIWQNKLRQSADYLLSVRPTEPMAQNGVKFIFQELNGLSRYARSREAGQKIKNVEEAKNCLWKAVNNFLILIENAARKILSQTQKIKIIENKENIFTHCHSYLVEQFLLQAKKTGKRFQVFNTETRPLFQGHITARNLLKAKIPVTMVADSASAFLISHYSGKNLMMDKVFLGADAVLKNGGVINKIGSFGISLAAHNERIPLYIITTLLKFHPKTWIKIERRSVKEIWQKAPKELEMINFAFDFIPAQYIKGIICEAGIIKPQEVETVVKKIYPWIIV